MEWIPCHFRLASMPRHSLTSRSFADDEAAMVGSIHASIAGRDCSSLSKSPPESTEQSTASSATSMEPWNERAAETARWPPAGQPEIAMEPRGGQR
jgi:hypothetical protein